MLHTRLRGLGPHSREPNSVDRGTAALAWPGIDDPDQAAGTHRASQRTQSAIETQGICPGQHQHSGCEVYGKQRCGTALAQYVMVEPQVRSAAHQQSIYLPCWPMPHQSIALICNAACHAHLEHLQRTTRLEPTAVEALAGWLSVALGAVTAAVRSLTLNMRQSLCHHDPPSQGLRRM